METSLRIILLLVAFFIVVGIVWDIVSSRKNKLDLDKYSKKNSNRNTMNINTNISNSKRDPFAPYAENPFDADWYQDENVIKNEDFEDVILVKPTLPEAPKMQHQPIRNDIITLNLMARKPGFFGGKKLIEAFHEAQLYFGEMDIFHRYENIDATGNIIFSVASALEPGFFQISKMETFVTEGITLFFMIEKPNQAIAAFELMLRTAKQLAMRLDGELKDDQHKFLTLQTIEKYRERVRLKRNSVFN